MARTKKPEEPIVFEKIGPTMWRCMSTSELGVAYNIAVIADDEAMCCCRGATRHGVNGCKHAKQLVEQGLAKRPKYNCEDCLDTGLDVFDVVGGVDRPRRCRTCNGAAPARDLFR